MARQSYVNGHDNDPRSAAAIVRLCTRATEMDPAYARAWALLANAQRSLRFAGKGVDDGLAAAERAIALDPGLAEGHAVRARVMLDSVASTRRRRKSNMPCAWTPSPTKSIVPPER